MDNPVLPVLLGEQPIEVALFGLDESTGPCGGMVYEQKSNGMFEPLELGIDVAKPLLVQLRDVPGNVVVEEEPDAAEVAIADGRRGALCS